MQVIEIFDSINGEGDQSGQLATFVRLNGCNLRCPYCDTKYSWGQEYTEMSVEEILYKVTEYGWKNVTITGGEPLIHKDIEFLLARLASRGFNVNVETNGSVGLDLKIPMCYCDNIHFTVDYKLPSSGQEDYMNPKNFSTWLRASDVIKFVVGSLEDLQRAEKVTNYLLGNLKCKIYVSPVFGQIEPSQIVDFMKERRLECWNLQLQIHKFIWDPEMRGV